MGDWEKEAALRRLPALRRLKHAEVKWRSRGGCVSRLMRQKAVGSKMDFDVHFKKGRFAEPLQESLLKF